jgi:hypothetical protein
MPFERVAVSFALRKRDSSASFTGQSAKRSEKFWKCCSASSVVGTSTATCLPSATATNAARSATSVLPKPTSPQIRRSIGLPDCRSDHGLDRERLVDRLLEREAGANAS